MVSVFERLVGIAETYFFTFCKKTSDYLEWNNSCKSAKDTYNPCISSKATDKILRRANPSLFSDKLGILKKKASWMRENDHSNVMQISRNLLIIMNHINIFLIIFCKHFSKCSLVDSEIRRENIRCLVSTTVFHISLELHDVKNDIAFG